MSRLLVGAATCRQRRSGTSACRDRDAESERPLGPDGSLRNELRVACGEHCHLAPWPYGATQAGREHGVEQRVARYQIFEVDAMHVCVACVFLLEAGVFFHRQPLLKSRTTCTHPAMSTSAKNTYSTRTHSAMSVAHTESLGLFDRRTFWRPFRDRSRHVWNLSCD